jgi:hypothetical protein
VRARVGSSWRGRLVEERHSLYVVFRLEKVDCLKLGQAERAAQPSDAEEPGDDAQPGDPHAEDDGIAADVAYSERRLAKDTAPRRSHTRANEHSDAGRLVHTEAAALGLFHAEKTGLGPRRPPPVSQAAGIRTEAAVYATAESCGGSEGARNRAASQVICRKVASEASCSLALTRDSALAKAARRNLPQGQHIHVQCKRSFGHAVYIDLEAGGICRAGAGGAIVGSARAPHARGGRIRRLAVAFAGR